MHHSYHIPGLTDLSKTRQDAEYRRDVGIVRMKEPTIIHHHEADEICTLNQPGDEQTHEIYELR